MIIVATELQVKSLWKFIPFIRISSRSFKQARQAPGCLHAWVGNKGWRTGYTLTAWESREAMLQYRNSGAHKTAMQQVSNLSRRYKTCIWEADAIPSWPQAFARLQPLPFKELK